jgi:hypothetical protein
MWEFSFFVVPEPVFSGPRRIVNHPRAGLTGKTRLPPTRAKALAHKNDGLAASMRRPVTLIFTAQQKLAFQGTT